MFFSAIGTTTGRELYTTSGTPTSTVLIRDLLPGASNGASTFTGVLSNKLLFDGTDGTVGQELYESDGVTSTGVRLVKDIAQPVGDQGSSANNFVQVGGTYLFSASNGMTGANHGTELWKTDGTRAGTVMVKDIHPGTASSFPSNFAVIDSTLFFAATDARGTELWKSDGTNGGTVRVRDINAGSSSSGPGELTNVNGTLFFTANNGVGGVELWKSDGSASGTLLVRDIRAGASSSSPDELHAIGDTVYFSANDGTNGVELWKSNGLFLGTVMVKDIRPGATGSAPARFASIGGTLYFRASDGVAGAELWKSNGSSAGTVLVKDIFAGSSGGFPENLLALGTTLFFSADDGVAGAELWKSNGTGPGTVRIRDIHPGLPGSSPALFADVNGTLFFRADDGTAGREYWKSDGTAAGTVLIKDIASGAANGASGEPVRVGSGVVAVFKATEGTAGLELWKSNGKPGGTRRVADINPGAANSSPLIWLDRMGRTMFFAATHDAIGSELFAFDLADVNATLAESYGAGCRGTGGRKPRMGRTDLPTLGNTRFTVNVSNGRHGAPAAPLLGGNKIDVDLGGGCRLLLVPLVTSLTTILSGTGAAKAGMPIPNSTSLLGLGVLFQWVVIDPGGGALGFATVSAGLEIVIGR